MVRHQTGVDVVGRLPVRRRSPIVASPFRCRSWLPRPCSVRAGPPAEAVALSAGVSVVRAEFCTGAGRLCPAAPLPPWS